MCVGARVWPWAPGRSLATPVRMSWVRGTGNTITEEFTSAMPSEVCRYLTATNLKRILES